MDENIKRIIEEKRNILIVEIYNKIKELREDGKRELAIEGYIKKKYRHSLNTIEQMYKLVPEKYKKNIKEETIRKEIER